MKKYIYSFVVIAMAIMLAIPVGAQNLHLGGSLINNKTGDFSPGLYSIKGDGSLSPLTSAYEAWATGGGAMKDGIYYCTCLEEIWEGFYYVTGFAFDAETWEKIDAYDLGTDLSFVATDLTYDATTGNIYGFFYDGTFDGFEFGTIEYGKEKSVRQTIAPLTVGYATIAAAADGTLYAVDYNGNLVKVNKENGKGTLVGNTGLVSEHLISATINQATGDMFMTMLDDDGGKLYKINTVTAEKTLVCTFANGEEIGGLFILDPAIVDIPNAVSDIAVNFIDNALTGTVAFTVPTATVGGDALTEELGYRVTANGEVVATGKTTPGAKVEAEITVANAENYEIAVVVSNTIGQSRKVSTSIYIGDDIPAAVQNIKLTYTDGQMSLSWDAPTGVNGGYVDQTKVAYNIARIVNGEETTVATNLEKTSFSEAFVELEKLSSVKYNVTAVYLGKESEVASSNAILVGDASNISIPYVEDFESEGIMKLITVIDANEDGQTWKIAEKDGNKSARIDCNEKMAMDDWLIMPNLQLKKGVSYSISFNVTTYNSDYFPERFEVFVGKVATVEAMKSGTQLIEPTDLRNLDNIKYGGTFIPEADGTYCVGIHGMSDADMFYIIIDDFTVAEGVYEAGPDVPAIVENISVEEISDGKVRISWTAPTTDINGKDIESELTYKIIDANYHTVVEELKATEYIYDAVEVGEQELVSYYVGATNSIGTGEFGVSETILVGTPYIYPYDESFTDGEVGSFFYAENPEGSNADWDIYDEATGLIPDADGTNGFIGMYGYAAGEQSSLFTGKISLAGAKRPVLSFYYNGLTVDNRNTMEVAVKEVGAKEWTVLKNFVQEGATEYYEWIKMILPLDDYKDKVIQLRWTPKRVNYEFGLIDGIKVDEAIDYDLVAKTIVAPTIVEANKEFNISVTIANDGIQKAENYTVELYRDGEKVQEMSGGTIECGTRESIVFKETLGVTVSEAAYNAVVVYDVDENNANNSTKNVRVEVKVLALPTVQDLMASQTTDGVKLSWSEPDLTNLPKAAVTEDFENATLFSQAIDGWTFIDGDDAIIGGISETKLPFTKASWFVMDYSDPIFNLSFKSHSGTKHLSTIFNLQGEKNDDWMISPVLCGDAQTISLWARSYISDYGSETMELLYSTTDNNPSSFVLVKEEKVNEEWKEYTFDVPEGAKYFAIRYTSKDVYMLFVDDVTYIPSNASAQNLVITGYNIYRDGVKINGEPVTEPEFTDKDFAVGQHSYVVTVVYEQGESATSNVATVDVSGISGVNVDKRHSNGNIYSASGSMVRKGNRTLKGLAKGVYIINGNKFVVK